jgi:hypothetical protein
MSNPQIVLIAKVQPEQLGCITQMKQVSAIDKIMMAFELMFGCWHRNLSRPFTLSGWTYEVCLNCGKKFAYTRTQIGGGVPKPEGARSSGTSWHDNQARVSLVRER